MRLLIASAIIATTAAAVAAVGLASPAHAETRAYSFSGFKRIEASAAFTIEFTQSPTYSVVVDSKYNTLDKIIIEKVGDTLRISRPKNTHIKGKVEDIIRISAPDLDALDLNAAIEFSAPSLNIDNLAIDANAAVTIDIANLKANLITIDADAATTLTLAGTCTKLDATLDAASEISADKLKCRETHIDAGTASTAHVFASEKAVARAGTASSVKVSGNPRDFQETHDRFGATVSRD